MNTSITMQQNEEVERREEGGEGGVGRERREGG